MLYYLKTILEISIIWFIYYVAVSFIRGTRAEQLTKGLIFLMLGFLISRFLNLYTLNFVFSMLLPVAVIAFLIIFQPELRQALASIGKGSFFSSYSREERMVDILVRSLVSMARKKVGTIIAIEQDIGLKNYIQSGVILNSEPSRELLDAIFRHGSPLHDGAVIISGDVVRSAASILPVSDRPDIPKSLGTRHRSAIGLSEETDALIIVTSEENGEISVARAGRLLKDVSEEKLREILKEIYVTKREGMKLFVKKNTDV